MVDGIMKKLPKDVGIYILVLLPVKSLLRFQCTCSTFCYFIKSSTFINLHLNRSTNTKDELILFKHSIKLDGHDLYQSILSFLSGEDGFDLKPVSPSVEVPHMTTTSGCLFHQLIGPSNGLVAITDSLVILLFNPTTRNYRLIPPCPFGVPKRYRRSISGIGFGFDSIANDYKFVRISEVYKDPCVKDMKVDIFDLSTDSWREINGHQLPLVFWAPCSEILYMDSFHWFASTDDTIIVCFGMSTEIFYHLQLPDAVNWYDGKAKGIVILGNYLTLLCYPDPMSSRPITEKIDIWMMKEYKKRESCIKRCSIGPLSVDSPLAGWKNDLLILHTRDGRLIAYDFDSDEVKEFNLHGCPSSLRVVVYKESLTPIPRNGEGIKIHLFEVV